MPAGQFSHPHFSRPHRGSQTLKQLRKDPRTPEGLSPRPLAKSLAAIAPLEWSCDRFEGKQGRELLVAVGCDPAYIVGEIKSKSHFISL